MNDPQNVPINSEDMADWLARYRAAKGLSWSSLAKVTNIPASTVSLFVTGKYEGNVANVAKRVFAFRQRVESQEQRANTALARPDYIETKSSRRIQILLEIAQMGRMTVAAMGPGTSKTMTAEHYKACMGDGVWLVTMRKTTGEVSPMIRQVMRAMGLQPRSVCKDARSEQIMDHVAGSGGLIIFDEANHLELDAIEEIRAWHDATGVGIALLGNEELALRIRGGRRGQAYARLARRIAQFVIQDLNEDDDVAAYLDAMKIEEPATRRMLIQIGTAPGHGGLGEVQQILESGHMMAIGEDKPLEHEHVQAARNSRVTQVLRRAA